MSDFMSEYREKKRKRLIENGVIGENDPIPEFHVDSSDVVLDSDRKLVRRVSCDMRSRDEILREKDAMILKFLKDPNVSSVTADYLDLLSERYQDEDGKWHSAD